MIDAANFDPSAVERLLSGCGLAVVNIAPRAGGAAFTVHIGPMTAKYGGIDEGMAALAKAGYAVSFRWASATGHREGYGRAVIDVVR